MGNRAYSGFVSVITVAQATNAYTCQHQCIYNPTVLLNRPSIYDVLISSAATPADNANQWALERTSTAPTGGAAITPSPVDPYDTAATTLDMSKPTGAAATGVVLAYMSVNQRVTWRWCAVPGGELVNSGAAGSGIALVSVLSATPAVCESTIFFRE
jgi:hypothetical protein